MRRVFLILLFFVWLILPGCPSPETRKGSTPSGARYTPPPLSNQNSSPQPRKTLKFPSHLSPPRVLVYMQGNSADEVTSTIEEKLLGAGLKLVDRNQIQNIKEVTAALTGDQNKLLSLKHRYGTEIILVGQSKSTLVLKAIEVDTGAIIASKSGRGANSVGLAENLAEEMTEKLIHYWTKRKNQGKEFDIVIANIIHPELLILEQYLKTLGFVTHQARRSFLQQTAFYNVGFQANREALEKHLLQCPNLPMEIERTTQNRIELIVAVARLFGKNISGQNIIFVLDVSGSMNSDNRLKRSKYELQRVLRFMDEKTAFNILAYSNRLSPWKPQGLHHPTPENRKSALAFIAALQAQGSTFSGEALRSAFGYTEVNALYFMSDGEPTGMKPPQILEMVNKLNQGRNVKIFSLGFKGANRKFMADLANQNQGDYKDIE